MIYYVVELLDDWNVWTYPAGSSGELGIAQSVISRLWQRFQDVDNSEANLQVYVETPLHPEKLTVWCALWAGGILLQKR
ncbi:hypothetical protein TNCV_3382101 [Trichonephila clavipes]|nr:hypothetical protein TNCV_3382101 [Trichonephila clavipes]